MRKFLITLNLVGLLVLGLIIVMRSEVANPQIIPGLPLYPLKVQLETWQLGLLLSPSQKIEFLLALASEREMEAGQLVDKGESWRLYEAFLPMRVVLSQAMDLSATTTNAGEADTLSRQISATILSLQSRLYDLRAVTPTQNLVVLDSNIAGFDALAEASIRQSHYLVHTSLVPGSPLAQGATGAVLGASDVRGVDYSAWAAVVAVLLTPFAFFTPAVFKKAYSRRHVR
jgi:hypothetical protein